VSLVELSAATARNHWHDGGLMEEAEMRKGTHAAGWLSFLGCSWI